MALANSFTQHSRYYDFFYADKDYTTEAQKAKSLINSHLPDAKKLLELGCGTGNHAKHFCKLGFEVTGIDKSEEMVAIAKGKGIENFHPVVSNIRQFQIGETFDAAVSLFHVMSYLTNNHDLISCLTAVSRHLHSGGLFVFDTWYSPAVYMLQPQTKVKRQLDHGLQLTRIAEPLMQVNANTVTVSYEIIATDITSGKTEITQEQHTMRHFSIPEVDLLCRLTGFELLTVQDLGTGANPGTDTWAVCFVLKKIGEPHTC